MQGYDRYAYVNNNPVRYTDPSGHSPSEGCGEEGRGVCHASELEQAINAQKLAKLEQESRDRKCAAGKYESCSGWSNNSRPVSGIHIGWSGQAGWMGELGIYGQHDYIVDWRKGDIYVVKTVGGSGYLGSPTGMEGTFYFGTTNVKGIPANSTVAQMNKYLSGPQVDASVSANLDAGLLAGVEKGVSVDWDTENNSPVYTPHVGYMYTIENSIQIGGNAAPNVFDFNIEGGVSQSFVINYIDLW